MESSDGAEGVFDRNLLAVADFATFFDGFDSVATRFTAGFLTGI
ncbi:hypothetical protein [Achromobacter pestifer]|nr:hypothetical protein [Achromobacter pestifer]